MVVRALPWAVPSMGRAFGGGGVVLSLLGTSYAPGGTSRVAHFIQGSSYSSVGAQFDEALDLPISPLVTKTVVPLQTSSHVAILGYLVVTSLLVLLVLDGPFLSVPHSSRNRLPHKFLTS